MCVEHEYAHGGALAYLATWDVHRAKVFGRCEQTAGIEPFDRLVGQVMTTEPYRWARPCLVAQSSGVLLLGSLGSEVGVAGEDPGPVLPGLDRVRTQPAPDGGARDRGDDARLDSGAGQVGALPPSQRRVRVRREFTGQRLDGDHGVRGKLGGRPPRGRSVTYIDAAGLEFCALGFGRGNAKRAGLWHAAPFVKGIISRNRMEVWDKITSLQLCERR